MWAEGKVAWIGYILGLRVLLSSSVREKGDILDGCLEELFVGLISMSMEL